MQKYNILIVEDDMFMRKTLEYEFKNNPKINIMASLTNGLEAVEYVKNNEPDIILMDIEMPIMDGIKATKNIKEYNSSIGIIMLTSHTEKENVLWAFSSGANGYCVKNIKTENLLNIMDIVYQKGFWVDNKVANYMFELVNSVKIEEIIEKIPEKKEEKNKITPREKNILKLMSDGLSNGEIAEQLYISRNTVQNHVANIIKKLSVKDRTQAILYAVKNDILKK